MSRKMATKRQVLDLLLYNSVTLVDLIGLDFNDVQLSCPKDFSSSLRISVRPGLKNRVPKELSFSIGDDEFYIDFEVDENFQDYDLR